MLSVLILDVGRLQFDSKHAWMREQSAYCKIHSALRLKQTRRMTASRPRTKFPLRCSIKGNGHRRMCHKQHLYTEGSDKFVSVRGIAFRLLAEVTIIEQNSVRVFLCHIIQEMKKYGHFKPYFYQGFSYTSTVCLY